MDNVENGKPGLPTGGWVALAVGGLLIVFMLIAGNSSPSPAPTSQASSGSTVTTAAPPTTTPQSYDQLLEQRQGDVLSSLQTSLSQRRDALDAEVNAAPRTFVGAGTWEVGSGAGQMPPGRWRTTGGSDCYWQRNSDASGNFDAILANGFAEGSTVVDIGASDDTFYVQGPCTWSKR